MNNKAIKLDCIPTIETNYEQKTHLKAQQTKKKKNDGDGDGFSIT